MDGLGLGVGPGVPVGVGLGVGPPNPAKVPLRIALPPLLIEMVEPAITTGTVCPLSLRSRSRPSPPLCSDMLPTDIPLGFVGETLDGMGGFMPCAPAADNFLTFYAKASGPALAARSRRVRRRSAAPGHANWTPPRSFTK